MLSNIATLSTARPLHMLRAGLVGYAWRLPGAQRVPHPDALCAVVQDGETPTWIAAYNGNNKCMEALLGAGANPDLAKKVPHLARIGPGRACRVEGVVAVLVSLFHVCDR